MDYQLKIYQGKNTTTYALKEPKVSLSKHQSVAMVAKKLDIYHNLYCFADMVAKRLTEELQRQM